MGAVTYGCGKMCHIPPRDSSLRSRMTAEVAWVYANSLGRATQRIWQHRYGAATSNQSKHAHKIPSAVILSIATVCVAKSKPYGERKALGSRGGTQ